MHKDIKGQKFSRLLVLSFNFKTGAPFYQTKWNCICDCGKEIVVDGNSLRTGNTTSCGCFAKERNIEKSITHGLNHTRLYKIYQMMKNRCCNKKADNFHNYGGRGIAIDKVWLLDFTVFYNWAILNGYSDNLTLERINVNGNYEPKNCTWKTHFDQCQNMRKTLRYEINGALITFNELCRLYPDINKSTLSHRLTVKKLSVPNAVNYKFRSKPRKK